MITGADEAGRGCVIGPLVICCASIEEKDIDRLREIGVKDSKKLTPKSREEIYKKLANITKNIVIKISAGELNELMGKYSLNEIEAMKMGESLNEQDLPENSIVYVDSPDNDPGKFALRIKKYLKKKLKIVSENYAESKYVIVAGASIIAKHTRDGEIKRIKEIVGYDFNSGYSSDPVTIDYLKKHMDDEVLKPYLRTKWKTLDKIRQKRLSDFGND